MPAYAYTGLSAKGKPVKGIESAESVAALKAALKRQGVYLTAVSETKATVQANSEGGLRIDLARLLDRVSPKTVAAITRLLGTLLVAGVTLPEALMALTEQVESQRLKGILSDVAERVNEGRALADALQAYPGVFPALYVNMVRAGEASGNLETVLMRLAEFMEKQEELKSKISSAMIYPLVMGFVGAGVVTLLMVKVVPQITGMFEDMSADLPWNTRLLIFVSHVLSRYWLPLLLLLGGAIYGFGRWRASPAGRDRWDRFVLAVPVVGDLARKVAITRFTRTLGTLLASGVQLLQALDIVGSLLGNTALEKVVARARDEIREGDGIAAALKRSGEFPPLVTHMIAVGERSGHLEQMLSDIAEAYDRETNTTIGRLTALLEPLMIVVMGVAVGFVVFSIMQPIMMLNQMAGR
jgi:general secretion pathway protein F